MGSAQVTQAPPPTNGTGDAVNWNTTYQTIDGFGAADVDIGPLTSAEANLFFSVSNGLGFSLLRTRVPDEGSCSGVNASCAGDITDMDLATDRDKGSAFGPRRGHHPHR